MTIKIKTKRTRKKSLAGSLQRYFKGESTEEILKDLREERRESDRF